ncbi:hypothetical protein DFP72DRAFT_1094268 [Ephemerocybe angulata]|uniref:Uncharacterized protein n=1 Tax=Ephemerocybe angulata TaxID=980116 RepID=A0A8H6MCX7_9AGAR|nr:hypothetical protein DFP72DRAFT_1094268 [Tulosesus angulatus]
MRLNGSVSQAFHHSHTCGPGSFLLVGVGNCFIWVENAQTEVKREKRANLFTQKNIYLAFSERYYHAPTEVHVLLKNMQSTAGHNLGTSPFVGEPAAKCTGLYRRTMAHGPDAIHPVSDVVGVQTRLHTPFLPFARFLLTTFSAAFAFGGSRTQAISHPAACSSVFIDSVDGTVPSQRNLFLPSCAGISLPKLTNGLAKNISPDSQYLIHSRKFFLPHPLLLRRRTTPARFRFIVLGPLLVPGLSSKKSMGMSPKSSAKPCFRNEEMGVKSYILDAPRVPHFPASGNSRNSRNGTSLAHVGQAGTRADASSSHTTSPDLQISNFQFPAPSELPYAHHPSSRRHNMINPDFSLGWLGDDGHETPEPDRRRRTTEHPIVPDLQKSIFRPTSPRYILSHSHLNAPQFTETTEGSTPVPGVSNNPQAVSFFRFGDSASRSSTRSVFRKSENQDFDAPLRVPDGA